VSSGVFILYDDLTDSTVTTSGVEVKAVGADCVEFIFLFAKNIFSNLSHKIINYYLS